MGLGPLRLLLLPLFFQSENQLAERFQIFFVLLLLEFLYLQNQQLVFVEQLLIIRIGFFLNGFVFLLLLLTLLKHLLVHFSLLGQLEQTQVFFLQSLLVFLKLFLLLF